MAEPLGPIVDAGRAIEVNRVLRSTYLLLAMAIGFAALTAFIGIAMGLPFMGFWPYLIGFFWALLGRQ